MADPVLVQHVAISNTAGGDPGLGIASGEALHLFLPNASLAGNCIIIALMWDYYGTPTWTVGDDQGQSYTSAVLRDSTTTRQSIQIFYKINSAAGVKRINVLCADYTAKWVQGTVSEWANIATSTPDVTAVADETTSGVTAWAATGTVAGNASAETPYLLYQVAYRNTAGTAASLAAASGYTLTHAQRLDQMAGASQYKVVTSSVTNPTITSGTSTGYVSAAIALKSASAGTLPTATPRIVHVQFNRHNTASPATFQFPSTGNLIVIGTLDASNPEGIATTTAITDSNENDYNAVAGSPLQPSDPEYYAFQISMWYAQNASTSPNLAITTAYTVTIEPLDHQILIFYDITGAAVSAYHTAVAADGIQSVAGNLTTCTFTPVAANELLIAVGDQLGGTKYGCVADGNGNLPLFHVPWKDGQDGTAVGVFTMDSGEASFLTPDTDTVTFIFNESSSPAIDWIQLVAGFKQAPNEIPIQVNLPADTLNGGSVHFG